MVNIMTDPSKRVDLRAERGRAFARRLGLSPAEVIDRMLENNGTPEAQVLLVEDGSVENTLLAWEAETSRRSVRKVAHHFDKLTLYLDNPPSAFAMHNDLFQSLKTSLEKAVDAEKGEGAEPSRIVIMCEEESSDAPDPWVEEAREAIESYFEDCSEEEVREDLREAEVEEHGDTTDITMSNYPLVIRTPLSAEEVHDLIDGQLT